MSTHEEDEVSALLDELAEGVWDLSEDEIDADLRLEGENPERVADAVDGVVLGAVVRCQDAATVRG